MVHTNKVIGIVGGMGPRAGIDLLSRVTAHTNAMADQAHLSAILMSFPGEIVDRTAFLNGDTPENPAVNIAGIIQKLEQAGAEVIGIACNTSHAPRIFNVIKSRLAAARSKAQLLHMPEETCMHLKLNYRHVSRVGLMATNGTYQSGLYKSMLEASGYEAVLPDFAFQDQVIHRMVYDPVFGIKASPKNISPEVMELLDTAIRFFSRQGAEAIILGCTEFSLLETVAPAYGVPVLDTTDILGSALVREATGASLPGLPHYYPDNKKIVL